MPSNTPTDAQCAVAYGNYTQEVQRYLMQTMPRTAQGAFATNSIFGDFENGIPHGGALNEAFQDFFRVCKEGESLAEQKLPFAESVLSQEQFTPEAISEIQTRRQR